jgi:hypothetical protein
VSANHPREPQFSRALPPVIASLGLTGRVEEARETLVTLQRLDPDFSIGWFRANYPPLQDDDSRRYIEGLRKAGVPES